MSCYYRTEDRTSLQSSRVYDAEEIFNEEKMEVEVKEWPHHVQQNYGKYFDEDYDLPLVYSTKLALIYFSLCR